MLHCFSFREQKKDAVTTTTQVGLWKINEMVQSGVSVKDAAEYKCTVLYSESGTFKGGSVDSKKWNINVIG